MLDAPRVRLVDQANFFRVARAGFSGKRKQLVNSLAHGLAIPKETAAAMLEQEGIDPTSRAEDLSFDQWARVASRFEMPIKGEAV